MGSKLIWIAAALAYGAVSAAIYVFVLWQKRVNGLIRKGIIAWFGYSLFALVVVWILLRVFDVE